MKIGFLSLHDPLDRRTFSGTAYYAYQALQQLPDVQVSVLARQYHLQQRIRRTASRLSLKLFGKKLDHSTPEAQEKACLVSLERDLKNTSIDVVVNLVSSSLIGKMKPNHPPIIFVTDATPGFIQEAYQWEVTPEDHQCEYQAIQNASKVVYSSDFIADRSRLEFASLLSENSDKLCVVPFGLNLDSVPKQVSTPVIDGQLRLLFVGRDWLRKGGDIALETLQQLRANNINAHLTIIGCTPDITKEQHVTVIPYLDKNNPKQQQQYFDILSRSHFLLLPTRADCTPMVIAEANAFGVPALVSDVGGVGTLVKPGLNGYLFPLTARGDQYAEVASRFIAGLDAYQHLSKMSRKEYETRLNWNAWAKQIYQHSLEVIQH